MKSFLSPVFLRLLAWSCVFLSFTGLRAEERLMGLKSAIVESRFEHSGMGTNVSGTKKTWMADYGRKRAFLQREKAITKIFGTSKTEEKETLNIMDSEWLYAIDLKKKTGIRMSVAAMKDFAAAYAKELNTKGKTMEQSLDEWLKKNNGKWIENETILGHNCRGFEVFGMRQWLYEQVPLKIEGKMMGMTTKEIATSLEENASISDDVFKVPAGIKMEEAPDMSALMGEHKKALAENEDAAGVGEEGGLAALMKRAQEQAEEGAAEEDPNGKARKHHKRDAERGGEVAAEKQAPSISFAEFKRLVSKLKVRDQGAPNCESSEGSHTALFMKSMTDSVIITMGGYISPDEYVKQAKAQDDGSAKVITLKRYTKKGHPAVFTEVGVEGSAPLGAHLMIFDNAKKLTLLIAAQPARPRAELEELVSQLGY